MAHHSRKIKIVVDITKGIMVKWALLRESRFNTQQTGSRSLKSLGAKKMKYYIEYDAKNKCYLVRGDIDTNRIVLSGRTKREVILNAELLGLAI